jgi:predicted Fe-Mo cluster-binding NifX family protein
MKIPSCCTLGYCDYCPLVLLSSFIYLSIEEARIPKAIAFILTVYAWTFIMGKCPIFKSGQPTYWIEGFRAETGGGRLFPIESQGETMMKIAVPLRDDGRVDEHFGHCKEFRVFQFDDGKALVEESVIPSADGCGCKSDIASVLAKSGVSCLVAGNMGEGAVRVLGAHGISVVRGASGDARSAAEAFAKGALADSGVGCAAHSEPGHECSR